MRSSDEQVTELAERLRRFLETNTVTPALFTEDVVVDMNAPLWRFQLRGSRSLAAQLKQDAPHERDFERRVPRDRDR